MKREAILHTLLSKDAFAEGSLEFLAVGLGFVLFKRESANSSAIIGINRWCDAEEITTDLDLNGYKTVFGNQPTDNKITINGESIVFMVSK